jgi:hypothetical protein
MSLSTALSLETLTPDALFAASERDLSELWQVRRKQWSSSALLHQT